MSKNLSQIAAEIFASPAGGQDLATRVQRLGDELRRVVQGEEAVFGRFHGLIASFQGIIPDEQQRYHAALKALSQTAKLSRQEIVKAMQGQIEELSIVEKGLLPALPGRDELKALEARAQGLKTEIAALRVRLAQLENEEKAVLSGMASLEKDQEAAGSSVKGLFAGIRAEISALSRKIEELPAEAPAQQPDTPPAPPTPEKTAAKSGPPARKKKAEEPKIEIQAAPAAQDTKFRKKCPMCGGPFNLLEFEKMWQCYACGHEEPTQ